MNPEEAAKILTYWFEDADAWYTSDTYTAMKIALIILIAFNNTLKEVSK